jgi:hypothetical protein
MTTDERDRLADLRRQALEFARSGGFDQPHNCKARASELDRQRSNRRRRRQAKQRARLVWGIAGETVSPAGLTAAAR